MTITPWHLKDYPLNKDDVLETGEINGYIWVTAKAPFYGINGYIRIPDAHTNHPWQEEGDYICDQDSFDDDAECWEWGEETFHDGRWHGFGTQHFNDAWPAAYVWEGELPLASKYPRDKWRTPESVVRQVQQMARHADHTYQQLVTTGNYTI
ncbi:hypothetical protein VVR12_01740 [Rothia sp. LK2588]|uniref:hypothetical protein n=1 Tax=Rothia sp. LK2588 TaxID=3114369 RepID=UPI0034CEF77F